ncbi:MAG: putative colanic acid biosynthesis acetyltransferase [Planctomycetota bacterium]|nr:putative colanic acid biosynthesis acetyltransferase [Planctomycetota bacterium]
MTNQPSQLVIDDEARHISPFSRREKVGRLAWALVQGTLFRYSFTTWYRWRNTLLRLFGARVHPSCRIRRTARFECPWNFTAGPNCAIGEHAIVYALGPITLGRRVSVSQYSHLCAGTHDFTRRDLPLIRPHVTLKDDSWLGADAFVGPGVTLHEGALLGARASAFKDLEPWTMYGGNPAKPIRKRPDMAGTPNNPLHDA